MICFISYRPGKPLCSDVKDFQYCGGCMVEKAPNFVKGMSSVLWRMLSTVERYHEKCGGYSALRKMYNTFEDVQYCGGYFQYCG